MWLGCPISLLLRLLVQVTLFLKDELWGTLQNSIIRMHYPQQSNHGTWHISREHSQLAFATRTLRNQASSPAWCADHRLTVENSLHPSNNLSELMHPSVIVVSSPPTLWQGLSGTDIWELQQELQRHEFHDDETSAQMCWNLLIHTSWPHLLLVGGNPMQFVCHILHIAMSHERKGKLLKFTLMQPAVGETESNQPTSGQVKEVHSFCMSPAIWLLATDAIARSTWRVYARTWVTQAEGKEIVGCKTTIGPLPYSA